MKLFWYFSNIVKNPRPARLRVGVTSKETIERKHQRLFTILATQSTWEGVWIFPPKILSKLSFKTVLLSGRGGSLTKKSTKPQKPQSDFRMFFAFQVFQINLCSCIIVSTLCDICCEVLEYFVFSSPIFRPIMNIRPPHLKNEATLFLFGSVAFMVQACKTMMIAFKTDINKHAYKHTLCFEKFARNISPFNLTNFF